MRNYTLLSCALHDEVAGKKNWIILTK